MKEREREREERDISILFIMIETKLYDICNLHFTFMLHISMAPFLSHMKIVLQIS